MALLAVLAFGIVIGADRVADRSAQPEVGQSPTDVADLVAEDRQPTLVVVTVSDADDTPEAVSIAVLARDLETGEGTLLLVPTETLTDVPGYGAYRLSDAFRLGGANLTGMSLENLLGVQLDAVVTLDGDAWSAIADVVGPLRVEVPTAVPATESRPGVPAGTGQLDGDAVAALVLHRSSGSELDGLPRLQRVVQGLLDAVADDPERAADLVSLDDLDLAGVAPDLVELVLLELAIARAEDRLTALTLPVTRMGTDDVYRPDEARIEQLVEDRLSASRVAGEPPVTLQVLNGNGLPAIGAEVAERLRDGNYRIVLSRNADRFTYETTRVLVHDDDPVTLAAANDLVERLGTGEVERSGTPQSVADVTILVGGDFP